MRSECALREADFLQNMVRILTGTLVEVGRGERTPEDMEWILESRDRQQAGFLMPAKRIDIDGSEVQMRQAENWTVWAKSRFSGNRKKKYGIDQVTARIMRNRDIITDEEINSYLNGTMDMLPSPYLLKDVKKAAGILAEKIKSGKKICIIGDYDIDGVQSSYILWEGIENLGGKVYVTIPDRIKDGYGVNEQLVEAAIEEGADTILTCDNGIAAADALKRAKRKRIDRNRNRSP